MTFKEFCKAKGIELTSAEERFFGAVAAIGLTFNKMPEDFRTAYRIALYKQYQKEHKS